MPEFRRWIPASAGMTAGVGVDGWGGSDASHGSEVLPAEAGIHSDQRIPELAVRTLTYVAALNEALHQAMAEDDSVIVLGENIRNGVRAETRGLDERFDAGRVLDMPISEAAFTGFANGAAMAGLRPVVEFQVSSLIYPAFDQIVNQAAKLRLMLGGQGRIPVTFFLMGAGAGGGRAGQHSDNPYPLLMHAGIKTLMPATPEDAKGMMLAAIFEDDPVALVAPAGLLGESGEVPEASAGPRSPEACGAGRGAM